MSVTTPELNTEIVRAGAGAGKTTALTEKVLNVAEQFFKANNRAPKIVVTTFTRKATEELRERLVREACQLDNPRLIDFVTTKSNLHISTIHGVLSLFLRRLGHWLNIDSGFRILEAQAADRIARIALREILVKEPLFATLLEDFTFSQLCGMVREYAATDSLNTKRPFTANDLQKIRQSEFSRIAEHLTQVSKHILVETQNEKWLEYAGHLIECAKPLASAQADSGKGINTSDWVTRLETLPKPRFISKSPPFAESVHDDLKNILKECTKLESEIFNHENDKVYVEKSEIFGRLAMLFSEAFTEKKLSGGQIEMDDLENITLQALRDHPEVAAAFSSDWDYWLIDEFQDTSPKQVELLNALSGRKPVFVVGDPQQSIYLFRGARSSVFAEKEKAILAGGGLKSELIKNYRSSPELLLFFNDFFTQLSGSFIKMEPKSVVTSPNDIVAHFCIVDKSVNAPYAPFALKILKSVNTGASFHEFCVLSRTNRELRAVAQYLESLNIPTHLHSSDGFYRRREVLDILSLLKFLLNPHDNKNLIRLLRSPWFRVEDQVLIETLAAQPSTVFYWSHLQQHMSNHTTIQRLEKSIQAIQEHGVFETLRKCVIDAGLIEASHIHDSTGRRESNIWKFFSLLREKERAPGFSYMNFVQNALRSLEDPDGDNESDAVAALEPNRVNLMTIHKAKGLKFNHVLLPNIGRRLSLSEARKHEQPFVFSETDEKFTLALRLGEDRKLTHNLAAQKYFAELAETERAEYLRVLYVAMTRAEKSVMLHWQEPVDKSSWAGLLKIALDQGVHKTANYSYKVEREFANPEKFIPKTSPHKEPRAPWTSSEGTKINQRRISVTRLIEEKFAAPSDVDINFSKTHNMNIAQLQKHIEAPVIGQRIHSYFENLKYAHSQNSLHNKLGNNLYDAQHLKLYCKTWFSKNSDEFEQAIKYVLELNTPPIAELIRNGEVEWGFQLQSARGIIEGQIDLWGTVNGETWIVDYKSGSARYQDKAFVQLELYSLALRARGIKDLIQLAVVYALEKKVEIRRAAERPAIESLIL